MVATAEEREWPEFRAFKLGDHELMQLPMEWKGEFPPKPGEWKGRVFSPDNDELRARIKDLEKRLPGLEKRLQK